MPEFEVTLGLDVTLNRAVKVKADTAEEAVKKAKEKAEKELKIRPFHRWDFDTRMGIADTEVLDIRDLSEED